MKSHEILIDDKTDLKKNDYTCLITVLFPFDESQPTLISEYNDLLEKYILKIHSKLDMLFILQNFIIHYFKK